MPISLSLVERIANIGRILGRRGGNIRLLVDHEAQIPLLLKVYELSGYPPNVYIAIDSGSHHLGVRPGSPDLQRIFQQIEQIVLREGPLAIIFIGFYCEPGPDHNYPSRREALRTFGDEWKALLQGSLVEGVRLSVPETPILYNLPLLLENRVVDPYFDVVENLKETLAVVRDRNHPIEVSDEERTFFQCNSFAPTMCERRVPMNSKFPTSFTIC